MPIPDHPVCECDGRHCFAPLQITWEVYRALHHQGNLISNDCESSPSEQGELVRQYTTFKLTRFPDIGQDAPETKQEAS